MSLIHLIYVSTARQEYATPELEKILDSSVRHNQSQDITGMLLYTDGCFLQVLEGEAEAVDETYARIQADPRHFGLIELAREEIAQRSFDQWSMGFACVAGEEIRAHPSFAPFFTHGFDPASIGAHPGLALNVLKSFGLRQQGWSS
ncbi:BLUF domain-containing protein [Thiobaca trueperi]|uniref:FAD-dependent sensor of blue light n=1 Tax=Thiobaca trueperi TaxID=127458 RepID=A0A4R3N6X2_9GAMM|nr:BLUF domain-containing protein [Thiobaca trueperi]TCT24237.1 FAD-dependent sensor of blue light [Thiobaca trueperi]